MAYVTPQTKAEANGSGTAVSVAFPSGISAGDLLLMTVVWADVGGTCSTPTGFTEVQQGSVATTSPSMATFFKIAVGSESGTIDATLSSNVGWNARSVRLTGNNAVGVSVSSENYDNTSDTSAVSATVTPTATSTLIMIVGCAGDYAISGYTVTTSDPTWTEYADAQQQSLGLAFAYGDRQVITATGAGSATLAGSARSAVHLLSCEPSGHSFSANFSNVTAINATESSAQTVASDALSATSMINASVAQGDPIWTNQDKPTTSTFTNLAKP
jgi:hypothetical protein